MQAPRGLLDPAGFASDGNAEIFASPLGALRAELGVQGPMSLHLPAVRARDRARHSGFISPEASHISADSVHLLEGHLPGVLHPHVDLLPDLAVP